MAVEAAAWRSANTRLSDCGPRAETYPLCFCRSRRDVQECVPSPFYGKQGSQLWLNMTTQHMQQVQPLNPHQARAQFLGESVWNCAKKNPRCAFVFFVARVFVRKRRRTKNLPFIELFPLIPEFPFNPFTPGLISAFPMFGSSFFYIHSCSSAAIKAPCILAVNLNGLHFLNKDTHVCHS